MDSEWNFITLMLFCLTVVNADDYVLEEPTQCEVCKYFVKELELRLDGTRKSKEVLRTGHGMESRKEFSYATSELRLIEAMDGICEKIMDYSIHKERSGSLRFAKGMSETFKTLHGLKDKGVKVDLGIPDDMWDEPSAEITLLKKQCELMLERHEESIEEWYFNYQDKKTLEDFLCKTIVLKSGNQECLMEAWTGAETKYKHNINKAQRKSVKSSRPDKPRKSKGDLEDELDAHSKVEL